MELRRYWATFRRWLWLIAVTTVLAGGAAFFYSKATPPVYQASVTLLVNLANNPANIAYNDLMASQYIAQTYSQLVRTRPVLDEVVKSLRLPMSSTQLEMLISVQVLRNTQVLQLSVEYGDPEMARDIANKTAEVFIAHNAELQRGQFQSSRDRLNERIAAVEADMNRTSDAIVALRSNSSGDRPVNKDAELARLQAQLWQYQSEYSMLLKSYDEMRLAEGRSFNTIAVAEPAIAPAVPLKPRPQTDTLLGAIVGLMLGVGAAFLLEYLDDTVKSSEDVDRIVGLATLAQVHRFHRSRHDELQAGLIAKWNPKSPLVESYRVLRTNLQYSKADSPLRTILVTSPVMSEGKTTTAGNLAAILAQSGKRVIIVDADLRRPALHRLLGLENSAGLTNTLVKEALDVSAVVQPTPVEGVGAVTSGPRPPYPAELLGSASMGRVLEALTQMADVVIIDTAPVLLATDAAALAAQVDGVVIVVEAGKTRADALGRAVESLMTVKQNVLGVVINKVSHSANGYYPGYYRGYYKGYYGEEKRSRSDDREEASPVVLPGKDREGKTQAPLSGARVTDPVGKGAYDRPLSQGSLPWVRRGAGGIGRKVIGRAASHGGGKVR